MSLPPYSDQRQTPEEQERFQAPPELLVPPTEAQIAKKAKRKKLFVTGLGIVTAVSCLIAILLIIAKVLQPPEIIVISPTPIPTQPPSNLQQELDRLNAIVDQADPAAEPFAPPPVDMEVEF